MCLFPKFIINKRYVPTAKNKGSPPLLEDSRMKYVPVGCGNCIECRKQKAREWKVRLFEEIKIDKSAIFVTLTFAPDTLKDLLQDCKQGSECNAVATLAVRRFLERYRKKHKRSIKHWLITELGHPAKDTEYGETRESSERIHLHGLIWGLTKEEINEYWQYGFIYCGDYVDAKTINYIVKYVTKIDNDHKGYKQIILSSKGIGANWINSTNYNVTKFNGVNTIETYRLPNGAVTALPIYYRNKRYSEEERLQLWANKLDADKRYVLGVEIENYSEEKGWERYNRVLESAKRRNAQAGYGDDSSEYRKKAYNVTAAMLRKQTKLRKLLNNPPEVPPSSQKPRRVVKVTKMFKEYINSVYV